jgi:1-aminocyclopropane-1-carboxylate deaminase/D-cysteine desulfhydrase-like pyridoxal-dependent ACC family enzyme
MTATTGNTRGAGPTLPGSFPRSTLATLPTPLERGPDIGDGVHLWVKRDDLTGLGVGGNKARKLEFLCGDALERGATALITVGAGQSNHCRMTAAAGAVLGLDVHLVLAGDAPAAPAGNQLLSALFGAQIHYTGVPAAHWGELEIAREQLTTELAADGAVPYSMPIGGGTAVGALGYLWCFDELMRQCDAAGIAPTAIVFTSASGGTHAGLLAGQAWWRSTGRDVPEIVAVGVANGVIAGMPDPAALAAETLDLAGCTARHDRSRRRADRRAMDRRRLRRAHRRGGCGHRLGGPHRGLGARPHVQRKGLCRPARKRCRGPLACGRRRRVHPHRRVAGSLLAGRIATR